MNDDEKYVRESIRTHVWSGFYDRADTEQMMEEILEGDVDADEMRRFIASEFAAKAAAERTWPKETDCDRLDRAFAELHRSGICALQNAGYTMSDGHSDVAEVLHAEGFDRFRGYCFYHGQDLERAVAGQGLMLAFADLNDDRAAKTAVGREVIAVLTRAGFKPEWNGDSERRIDLPIDWKRRTSR